MRLKSLSLKNYRQYKDSYIEFGDGITGIVGLNGAGKSTIVEAMAWALYGNNAARTEKEGIKRSTAPISSNVEAELIMEIGGTEYRIVRVLKGSSQTGAASIIANGKVIADSVKGVDKEVNYLLGMDWKSFYTSFFAKQKELNYLTTLKAAERRDLIIRMLRIDAVDKVIDATKKGIKERKLELDILKKSLKDTNILTGDKMILQKDKKKAESILEGIEVKIKAIETDMLTFKTKFTEERAIFNKYTQLDKKRAEIEASLIGLSKRESELNDEVEEIKRLGKELDKLEKAYKEYNELEMKQKKLSITKESEIRTKENKLEELRDKYKEMSKNKSKLKIGQPCPTCGQLIKNKKTIEEHFDMEMETIEKEGKILKAQLAALKEEKKSTSVKDLKFDFENYAKISGRLDELQDSHDEYPIVKAKVDKKERLDNSLAKIVKELKDLEAALNKALSEIKDIPYDEKEHEKITTEYDTAQTDLNKYYSQRNDLRLQVERLTTQINDKQKEIKEAEDSSKRIDKETLSQQQQERFIKLVTDYRQYLISRIGPKLADISGRLLNELTNGKYTGVELDDEYNLFIYDGNIKYPLQRFSGGESDIANLCLRLAISQLIAESSGIETGFIILDEIFGSQDMLRKSSIIEALNRLSKQFRQIILITHIEDIKDTLENIIEVVENEEGISSIKA